MIDTIMIIHRNQKDKIDENRKNYFKCPSPRGR
jgi:hypothetical protein